MKRITQSCSFLGEIILTFFLAFIFFLLLFFLLPQCQLTLKHTITLLHIQPPTTGKVPHPLLPSHLNPLQKPPWPRTTVVMTNFDLFYTTHIHTPYLEVISSEEE